MIDPTHTTSLRKQFERKLTVRFNRLFRDMREIIVQHDVFGLRASQPFAFNAAVDVTPKAWSFLTDERKLAEFETWLQQETDLVIEPGGDVWESFVERGYQRGAGKAFNQAVKAQAATTVEGAFLAGQRSLATFGGPVAVEKVKALARRTFTDLKGVTDVLGAQIQQDLLDGFVRGASPNEIAAAIAERTGKGIQHARRIARTEIIRAHAEGQLDQLEALGVAAVGVMVEFTTAGDALVCPQCSDLAGQVFKIKEAHGIIPVHANCRCAFVPFVP